MLIYDEQNRVTRINDFNKHYNNTTFNSKTIINHFVKYPKTSFNEKVKSGNKSSKKFAEELVSYNIATRNDNFYAWRCLEYLGIDTKDGVIRLSMTHYNSNEDTNKLLKALSKIK